MKASSMLGKASWATPKAQERKDESGIRASSAVSASASRTAVAKRSGEAR
jgi:hypothetical protein